MDEEIHWPFENVLEPDFVTVGIDGGVVREKARLPIALDVRMNHRGHPLSYADGLDSDGLPNLAEEWAADLSGALRTLQEVFFDIVGVLNEILKSAPRLG
jgi:hypothetical protein